jgi:hypothetical protein
MQLDPAPRLSQPFPHEFGMMIGSVVEKDMDEREQRIERLDRFQDTDRRGCVNGQGLYHPGLAGLQIDCAVDVDALTPLVCSIASFSWRGAQQPAGRAAWVGCTASTNTTASLFGKEFKRLS